MCVGAIKNREITKLATWFEAENLTRDIIRLARLVHQTLNRNRVTLARLGEKRLAGASFVLIDDTLRGFKNVTRAAIILLQLHYFSAREIALEIENIGEIGAAPRVNRLPIVADNANIALGIDQKFDHFVLHGVGVLILINQDVLEFLLPFLPNFGVILQ